MAANGIIDSNEENIADLKEKAFIAMGRPDNTIAVRNIYFGAMSFIAELSNGLYHFFRNFFRGTVKLDALKNSHIHKAYGGLLFHNKQGQFDETKFAKLEQLAVDFTDKSTNAIEKGVSIDAMVKYYKDTFKPNTQDLRQITDEFKLVMMLFGKNFDKVKFPPVFETDTYAPMAELKPFFRDYAFPDRILANFKLAKVDDSYYLNERKLSAYTHLWCKAVISP